MIRRVTPQRRQADSNRIIDRGALGDTINAAPAVNVVVAILLVGLAVAILLKVFLRNP
jgi:hypothetical protein